MLHRVTVTAFYVLLAWLAWSMLSGLGGLFSRTVSPSVSPALAHSFAFSAPV